MMNAEPVNGAATLEAAEVFRRVRERLAGLEAEQEGRGRRRGGLALDAEAGDTGAARRLATLEKEAAAAEVEIRQLRSMLEEAERRVAADRERREAEEARRLHSKAEDFERERVATWRRFESKMAEAAGVFGELEAGFKTANYYLHAVNSSTYMLVKKALERTAQALKEIERANGRDAEERALRDVEGRKP